MEFEGVEEEGFLLQLQRKVVDLVGEIRVGDVHPCSCFVFGRTENFFGLLEFFIYKEQTQKNAVQLEIGNGIRIYPYYQNHMHMSLSYH